MNNGYSILQVLDLRKYFPVSRSPLAALTRQPRQFVRAVDSVSFSLDRGEILALVGESGSGKTTVGMNVLGLQTPTQGQVLFEGLDVAEWAHGRVAPASPDGVGPVGGGASAGSTDPYDEMAPGQRPDLAGELAPGQRPDLAGELAGLGQRQRIMRLRERAQMIFQDPYESLNPRQTIYDIVAEPLRIHKLAQDSAERESRVRTALETCGLAPAEHFWGRYPGEISGGQRQRVVIAGALVLEPDLLVADEPVSMLDVSIRAEILSLLHALRDERDISILYTTHDLATAGYFTDRMAVMYLGRIVELGPTRAVLSTPRHPYTRALISVVPVPNPRRRHKRTILQGEIPNPIDIPPGCRFHPRCPDALPECQQIDPQLHPVAEGHEAACIRV